MPVQILLNLLIAFIWMFLHDAWNVLTFTVGYLIGMAFIFALRRFFPDKFYLRKVFAIINLMLLFTKELILSSALVIKQVTRPTINVTPGIFKVETQLETDWEITILCCLLTLTPGSVVLEVAPEARTLYIHAMDIPKSEQLVLRTTTSFERAIMEVMR